MPEKRLTQNYHLRKSQRGQSLIEFALVSSLLFFLILGVIEFSRLLFVYSVVSNAAQEGSRYGIRPRDVIAAPAATQTALAGGPHFISSQVVSAGGCNVIDNTVSKVYGIDPSAVNVSVWYDNGDGTPIVPTTRTPSPYDTQAIVRGNRIDVEATYNFRFISPFLSALIPNGINVKIRSARTILNNGGSTTPIPCRVNSTPAPIPTGVIPSPTPSATSTDLPFPTVLPTFTPTGTSTPTTLVSPSATGTATITPSPTTTGTSTLTPTRTATLPPGAPTNTPGPTNTPVPTSTSTPTRTATATATATATITITATPTPRSLIITFVDAAKKPQNGSQLSVLVRVTDGGGVPFAQATVVASAHLNGNPTPYVVANLPSSGNGDYQGCPVGNYNNGDVVTVDITANAPGYIGDSKTGVLAVSGNLSCH